jgi:histidine triad (HIT) family protein
MADDVFCNILRGDIPGEFLYRDEEIAVIRDINPHAPVHLLIIPVAHFEGIGDVQEQDAALLGRMVAIAHRIAGEQGLDHGYRLIFNEGEHGGKIVPHLHMHLLGGKQLGPKLVNE